MANKATLQALQAKEKVLQDEIEKFKKLQKGSSAVEKSTRIVRGLYLELTRFLA